jgi:hypothetical protein
MARTITVELNDLDEKCMRYLAANPDEWVRNFVTARIFAAKQEIYQTEVRRMTADPAITTIPADVDTVVAQADIRFADVQPDLPPVGPPGV